MLTLHILVLPISRNGKHLGRIRVVVTLNGTIVVARHAITFHRRDAGGGMRRVSMRVRVVTALLAAVLVTSSLGIMVAGRLTSSTVVTSVSD